MKRTTLPGALLVALLVATPASAAPPPVLVPDLPERAPLTAERKAAAKTAYADVQRHYGAGDYEAALAAADEVFEIHANASTALLRAQLLQRLGRGDEAFAVLLVAADLDPTESELGDVKKGLAASAGACDPARGWATIRVEPRAATVLVAGGEVPAGRTLGVLPGKHPVEVSADGHETRRAELVVRAGEHSLLSVALKPKPVDKAVPSPEESAPEPIQPPPEAAEPPGAPPPAAASSNTLAWVLIGSGAALAGGGVGMHLWANSANDEAEKYGSPIADMDDDERQRRYDAATEDLRARGISAVVLYGAGAVAAVTGLILLLSDDGADEASFTVAPMPAPGGAGITLRGGF